MVKIAKGKRIDWNTIRAEYVGGGISQRKLAKKYGVSDAALMKKANVEGWAKLRKEAESKSIAIAQQKTADAAADNATIAVAIRRRLLERLKRIEAKYPMDATEARIRNGNSLAIYRLRDLTAAYKDLTEDLPKGVGPDVEDLSPLVELLRE